LVGEIGVPGENHSGRESSSCSTRDTSRVTVKLHEHHLICYIYKFTTTKGKTNSRKMQEKFEDTKGVIRSRKLKNDIQWSKETLSSV